MDIGVVSDQGRGLSNRKKGLRRLLGDILHGRVARLMLVTKDWLLRLSNELLFPIYEFFHVDDVVLDVIPYSSRHQQLTENLVVEIMTVFSSCLSRKQKGL